MALFHVYPCGGRVKIASYNPRKPWIFVPRPFICESCGGEITVAAAPKELMDGPSPEVLVATQGVCRL